MPYPTRLLHEDEDVLIDAHPHWIRLVRPIFFGLVVLGGCGVLFVEWSSAPTGVGIAIGVIVLIVIAVELSKILSWRSTHFVVTSRRVVTRSGVLRRVGREIPIGRVQDVTYSQRFRERLVGVGTIVVESAGKAGDERFINVRKPEMIQSIINRAQSDAADFSPTAPSRSRRSSRDIAYADEDDREDTYQPVVYREDQTEDYLPVTRNTAPSAPTSMSQRLSQLTDLHERGIVTDSEFEEKKAELLGDW